ncbi:MAG: RT0821/Lpp0805 family surface protein [Gammaproteobacteria bacterium]
MGLRLTLIVALSIMTANAVMAQNTMFLRKSPIAQLNEQDRKLLRDTIDKLLVSPDGTVLDWQNPDTGSGGRVKVLDTEESDKLTCRKIRARNQARGRQADGIYRLCKEPEGEWRFASTDKSVIPENSPDASEKQP